MFSTKAGSKLLYRTRIIISGASANPQLLLYESISVVMYAGQEIEHNTIVIVQE